VDAAGGGAGVVYWVGGAGCLMLMGGAANGSCCYSRDATLGASLPIFLVPG
jgi:hypothetical protein